MGRKTRRAEENGSATDLPPDERHEKFLRENGEWNQKVEKSISKLEKAADGSTRGRSREKP
jgi:hypothetical protein